MEGHKIIKSFFTIFRAFRQFLTTLILFIFKPIFFFFNPIFSGGGQQIQKICFTNFLGIAGSMEQL